MTMDHYEDFERLRAKAEALGYRLWKWCGWHVTYNGVYVKRWINAFDAATLEAWLNAKASDTNKLHPLPQSEREAAQARMSA